LASVDDIKGIIKDIHARRNRWVLSKRAKNFQTLTELAISAEMAFDIIDRELNWQDYISGPSPDNHADPVPGDIWVFGLTIEGEPCYLKIQDRPSGRVMWISLHIAAYPMDFPYKQD